MPSCFTHLLETNEYGNVANHKLSGIYGWSFWMCEPLHIVCKILCMFSVCAFIQGRVFIAILLKIKNPQRKRGLELCINTSKCAFRNRKCYIKARNYYYCLQESSALEYSSFWPDFLLPSFPSNSIALDLWLLDINPGISDPGSLHLLHEPGDLSFLGNN